MGETPRSAAGAGAPQDEPPRGPPGALLASAIGLVAVAFVVTAIFALKSGRELLQTQAWVAHTLTVLLRAEAVGSAVLEAESSQRGYLLLGEPVLLGEFESRSSQAAEEVGRLRTLTADNPGQQARVAELGVLVERRLQRLRQVVVLANEGRRAEAVGTLASAETRELRSGLRRSLDRIVEVENDLLTERLAAQRTALERAGIAYLAVAVIGVGMLIAFGILTRGYFRAQRVASAALVEREEQFRRIADSLPQLVFVTDAAGNVVLANERWRLFTGLDPGAVQKGEESSFVHPDDLPGTLEAWTRALSTLAPYEHELRVRRRDGAWIWHLARAVPLPDARTGALQWLGSMTDIDDRRQSEAKAREAEARIRELNAALEHRADELAEVNRELESFSYSVSHDLRAPLRHVDGFGALLERRLGDGIDEKAAHYLRVIRDATRDLGRLVDDLLAFSRLGRQPLATVDLPLGPLVQQAATAAAALEPQRRIQWSIAALPTVKADPALLRVVFDNLLGNAVKYSRRRDPARIEVDATSDANGERTIRVADNGAGFDMRYADKLFGVFQRLHSEREFEGTGIGLATVQRVLHRHGGRIRAEAAIDQGATFYITIPGPVEESS